MEEELEHERKHDYIFYILIGFVVLWIILKLAGIIESPTIVEISPFAVLVLTVYYIRNEIRKDITRVIMPFRKDVMNKFAEHEKILITHGEMLQRHEAMLNTILHFKENLK